MSRSEWVCTLPPWRRLLATFNWRPVYDIEQRTRQLRIESLESETRTEQLKSEFEQRELERDKRLKQLDIENRRLAALESKLDALLLNADSSSQTPPATGSN